MKKKFKPKSQEDIFKDTYVDADSVLHWYGYWSDESKQEWLSKAINNNARLEVIDAFLDYCKDNGYDQLSEVVYTEIPIPEYATTEYKIRSLVNVSKQGTDQGLQQAT